MFPGRAKERTVQSIIHILSFFVLVVVAILVPAHPALSGDSSVERVDVFVSGQEGYHTFRIPAVIATPKQTLLAFCEGRKTSSSDHGDLDLVLKRSSDGGRTWGPLELVYEEGGDAEITIGNPCPVVDASTGTIWLPLCRNNDQVLLTHSSNDGRTWTKPIDITSSVKKANWGWYATGPGVGIQLATGSHRGRLVIPCDHRGPVNGRQFTISHVFYSDDHGQSWQLGDSVGLHTNECQVVELNDGRLMINMRNYWGRHGKDATKAGMRAVSYSDDAGQTWSELEFHDTLVEPVCQASFLKYSAKPTENPRLLFSNPASKKKRHQLTVRLSDDEGRSWPVSRVLHAGPAAYSCLVVLPKGSIGCLYEGGSMHPYEKLVFARFPVDWLNGTDESH